METIFLIAYCVEDGKPVTCLVSFLCVSSAGPYADWLNVCSLVELLILIRLTLVNCFSEYFGCCRFGDTELLSSVT